MWLWSVSSESVSVPNVNQVTYKTSKGKTTKSPEFIYFLYIRTVYDKWAHIRYTYTYQLCKSNYSALMSISQSRDFYKCKYGKTFLYFIKFQNIFKVNSLQRLTLSYFGHRLLTWFLCSFYAAISCLRKCLSACLIQTTSC